MHVEKQQSKCVYDVSECIKRYYVGKEWQAVSMLSGPSRCIDFSLLSHLCFHSTLAIVRTHLDESVF